MDISVKKLEDNTLQLTIKVPWKDVEHAREEVIGELIQKVEIPGFRKGKAPRNIAEQKLSKEAVQEEVLRKVLGKTYNEAVTQEKLSPIISPRIHVETFEDGTDLTFTAETCEMPEAALGDYKKEVGNVTAKGKIVVPGKEEQKVSMDDVMEALLKSVTITIPKVLIDQEVNRLLSQMLDELKTLGLSLEEYLASRGKTGADLRKEHEVRAEKDLKLEFTLRKIADTEKITVEEKDIQDVINSIKDEREKQQIMQNPYLIAALIRQQKTLDYLSKI